MAWDDIHDYDDGTEDTATAADEAFQRGYEAGYSDAYLGIA